MNKKIFDITDINSELNELNKRSNKLEKRLYAIALHYKHYIDNSLLEPRLFELRDNIIYRLFSCNLHLKLLIEQQNDIKYRCEKMFEARNFELLKAIGPSHPIHEHFKKEISSVFDSLVYHIVSMYDYFSSLVYYVYAPKGGKQNNIKWTSLAKIVRNNSIFPQEITESIININNIFVHKVYEYRSYLIHEKSDLNEFYIHQKFDLTKQSSNWLVTMKFLATEKFIKQFSQLKKKVDGNVATTSYVSLWLVNKALDHITDLLFDIKKDIEKKPNPPGWMLVIKDPITKAVSPVSKGYWFEEEYFNNKK